MISEETKVKLAKLFNIIPAWGSIVERRYTVLSLLDRKNKLILDAGCGWAELSKLLARCGRMVIGVDILKQKLMKEKNFSYVVGRVEQLPFKKGTFDQIFCMDVIEHLKDDKVAVKEIGRVLKRNGKVIITTPSNFWRYPYWKFMKYFTTDESTFLRRAGHIKKGYALEELKALFDGFEIEDYKFYINNGFSALAYDIEFSYFRIIENLLLKVLGLFLLLNFKLASKSVGTHIGARLVKK